jgi:hypothetical protein
MDTPPKRPDSGFIGVFGGKRHHARIPSKAVIQPIQSVITTTSGADGTCAEAPQDDPYAIQRDFPIRWSEYLKKRHTSHREVAKKFRVDERTARRWWAGTHGPHGWAVQYAQRNIGPIFDDEGGE